MTIQDDITAQTRKTVKQAQDFTIVAINAVADRVTPLLPKFDTDRLPKLRGLENLPKPVEVVEKAFDLSSALLASARNVAVEATKAWAPEATKPVAKKTPAKKTVAAATAAE